MDARGLRRACASPVGRWLPVLLWMAGIFYFSSRPDPLAFVGWPSTERDALGRAAHVAEYAGLTFLLHRALATGEGEPSRGARAYLLAGVVSLAYALTDEVHQMSVPGREASAADVGLDALGAATALGLLWMHEKRSAVSRQNPPPSAEASLFPVRVREERGPGDRRG